MWNAKGTEVTYARENRSTRAVVYQGVVFATGAFKVVHKGKYTEGSRSGEECVHKYFKTGSVFEDSYFDSEMKVVNKALELLTNFNDAAIISPSEIYLNMPAVWQHLDSGERCLVEPMVENFEKYNSNTGWNPKNPTAWTNIIMQALSHFTYHCSRGELLLCDLQGGTYILTDPAVISRTRAYGPSDLGPEGFSTFFSQHKCSDYCYSDWILPTVRQAYHQVQEGSTMELPTRESRAPMSCQHGGLVAI